MSDEESVINGEQGATNELSQTRVLRWLCAIVVIITLISAVSMPADFTVGIFAGGLGSILNYFWLNWSFSAMIAKAVLGEKRRFLATRFVMRYVFFGAVLLVVYYSGIVPVTAVIFGLASFGLAVFAEGLVSTIIRETV